MDIFGVALFRALRFTTFHRYTSKMTWPHFVTNLWMHWWADLVSAIHHVTFPRLLLALILGLRRRRTAMAPTCGRPSNQYAGLFRGCGICGIGV